MNYLKYLFIILAVTAQAQNYSYGLEEKKPKTVQEEIEPVSENLPEREIFIVPSDFNWSVIPNELQNTIWEIEHNFDLKGQTVVLPKNVLIRFKGGILQNGELRGDNTEIETSDKSQIFADLELAGTFKSEYLKPYWFGAIMDGIRDDRLELVETLKQATSIKAKVLIEYDIFLDLETTGNKSIFLDNNSWLEGKNSPNIIINNLFSPAFFIALTKDVTIKNLTFLYDQSYEANFGWNEKIHSTNTVFLANYLTENHNLKFESSTPITKSPISWRSVIFMDAPEDVLLENVTFKAKGSKANQFIQWAIKLKEEYKPNQVIIAKNRGETKTPKNIELKNVTLDGVIMGIQGIVSDFKSSGLQSYRYSDVQDANGNSIGGSGTGGQYWMHPPHLIYLNSDDSPILESKNIIINNTTDYGIYVGSEKVRGSHGYCHSLKLVDNITNAKVSNYKSYRRDGLWDLGNLTNSEFKNIYSESTSEIFDDSWKFQAARFLGELNNCLFQNITVKDVSETSQIFPWDVTHGNQVIMDNVQIYVNDLNTTEDGPFGIYGSNNQVINSGLHISKHSSSNEHLGVIAIDTETRLKGYNNRYEITVKGWRKLTDYFVSGKCIKLIIQDKSNPNINSNYGKVIDETNNYISEVLNGKRTDYWSQSESTKILDKNGVLLNTKIPNSFSVTSVKLVKGSSNDLNKSWNLIADSSDGEVLIAEIPPGRMELNKNLDLGPFKLNQGVYLKSNKMNTSSGNINISIQLKRIVAN